MKLAGLIKLAVMFAPSVALASEPTFNCAGAAMAGGAQMICSSLLPDRAQDCSYSWTLQTMDGAPSVVDGSFRLAATESGVTVYQGMGFSTALGTPVVLCHAEGRARP